MSDEDGLLVAYRLIGLTSPEIEQISQHYDLTIVQPSKDILIEIDPELDLEPLIKFANQCRPEVKHVIMVSLRRDREKCPEFESEIRRVVGLMREIQHEVHLKYHD